MKLEALQEACGGRYEGHRFVDGKCAYCAYPDPEEQP